MTSFTGTFTLLEGSDYVWPDAPCKGFDTRKDNAYKAVPSPERP